MLKVRIDRVNETLIGLRAGEVVTATVLRVDQIGRTSSWLGSVLGREPAERRDLVEGSTIPISNRQRADFPLGTLAKGEAYWIVLSPPVYGYSTAWAAEKSRE